MSNPKVLDRIRTDVEAHNAQVHRWADIVDDAEAFAIEILAEVPPYDWGDAPN